jgi:hypothetical protein
VDRKEVIYSFRGLKKRIKRCHLEHHSDHWPQTLVPVATSERALCLLAEVKRTKRVHKNRADSVERRTFQAANSITWKIIPCAR